MSLYLAGLLARNLPETQTEETEASLMPLPHSSSVPAHDGQREADPFEAEPSETWLWPLSPRRVSTQTPPADTGLQSQVLPDTAVLKAPAGTSVEVTPTPVVAAPVREIVERVTELQSVGAMLPTVTTEPTEPAPPPSATMNLSPLSATATSSNEASAAPLPAEAHSAASPTSGIPAEALPMVAPLPSAAEVVPVSPTPPEKEEATPSVLLPPEMPVVRPSSPPQETILAAPSPPPQVVVGHMQITIAHPPPPTPPAPPQRRTVIRERATKPQAIDSLSTLRFGWGQS